MTIDLKNYTLNSKTFGFKFFNHLENLNNQTSQTEERFKNLSLINLTKPPYFIIYIKSHLIFGQHNRNLIRNTWGKNLKLIFICVTEFDSLETVQFHHPDLVMYDDMLLVANFKESSDHLTIKVLSILHFHKTCYEKSKHSVYSMITDDDVYFFMSDLIKQILIPVKISIQVNQHQLHQNSGENGSGSEIQEDTTSGDPRLKNIITGRILWTGQPVRHPGKYHIPEEIYPFDVWPPFATGICSIFSPKIPFLMYRQIKYVPYIKHLDDAYLGVLVHFNNLEYETNIHLQLGIGDGIHPTQSPSQIELAKALKQEKDVAEYISYHHDKRLCHGRENDMLSCDYLNFHKRQVDTKFLFERQRQCFLDNGEEFTDPNF